MRILDGVLAADVVGAQGELVNVKHKHIPITGTKVREFRVDGHEPGRDACRRRRRRRSERKGGGRDRHDTGDGDGWDELTPAARSEPS